MRQFYQTVAGVRFAFTREAASRGQAKLASWHRLSAKLKEARALRPPPPPMSPADARKYVERTGQGRRLAPVRSP